MLRKIRPFVRSGGNPVPYPVDADLREVVAVRHVRLGRGGRTDGTKRVSATRAHLLAVRLVPTHERRVVYQSALLRAARAFTRAEVHSDERV